MTENMFKNKKAQEEMIGFGFIIIIVAVILLIFISFIVMRPDKGAVESYEIESFIQSMLLYTSDCEILGLGHASIQKLIYNCKKGDSCTNDKDSCEVLEETIEEILEASWQIEDRPVEAYSLQIISGSEIMLDISKGNKTGNFKGSTQKLHSDVSVIFNVYY